MPIRLSDIPDSNTTAIRLSDIPDAPAPKTPPMVLDFTNPDLIKTLNFDYEWTGDVSAVTVDRDMPVYVSLRGKYNLSPSDMNIPKSEEEIEWLAKAEKQKQLINDMRQSGYTEEDIKNAKKIARLTIPAFRSGSMTGSIAGGIAGAKMGSAYGPWGTAIGGVVGTGIGSMGGEMIQQGVSPYEDLDTWKAAKMGMWDMAFETATRGAQSVFSKSFREGGEKSLQILKKGIGKGTGISPLPSQISGNPLLTFFDELGAGSFIGKKANEKWLLANQAKLKQLGQRIALGFGKTGGMSADDIARAIDKLGPTELGQDLFEALGPKGWKAKELDEFFDPAYRKVFGEMSIYTDSAYRSMAGKTQAEIMEQVNVSIGVSQKYMKQFAKGYLAKDAKNQGRLLARYPKFKEYLGKVIDDKRDKIPWGEFKELRTEILAYTRDVGEQAREIPKFKELNKLMYSTMTDPKTAEGLTEEGAKKLKALNQVYKETYQTIEKVWPYEIIEKFEMHPELYEKILQRQATGRAKDAGPETTLKVLRESIIRRPDKTISNEGLELWRKFSDGWTANNISKYTKPLPSNPHIGTIDFTAMANDLDKIGDDSLKILMGSEKAKNFKDWVHLGKTLQIQVGDIGSARLSRYAEIGGAGLIIAPTGHTANVVGAGMLIGPEVWGKLATTKSGQVVLRNIFSLPKGAAATSVIPTTVKTIRAYLKIKEDEDRKMRKALKEERIREAQIRWHKTGSYKEN